MDIINHQDIVSLNISPTTCVEWAREAFLIKDQCQLPPKMSLHPRGTDFVNTMPCILPEKYSTFGCKIVTRVKGNHPALHSELMIFNTSTGKMTSLMNADWITAMRTGAVATLSINTLRSNNASIYSFVGLGTIGHATLDCLLDTNPDRCMTIRLKKYKNHAEETIAKYKFHKNVQWEICESMEELVDGADVIVSCITDAEKLLVEDISLFKKGVLVVPVHTRGFQNCDSVFDKVFADDEGHVKGFKYFKEFRKFGEMAEILSEKIHGRETDDERILAYNIGIGLHDIYFGYKILNLVKQEA